MALDLTAQFRDAERILVFGGPYSNLQATRAMRATAATLDIPAEHTICTGDVVAYCANPAETVAEIRDWGVHVVAGNCEQQLAADADNCACGFDEGSACDVLSKGWYGYADARITADDRLWMGGLSDALSFAWAGRRLRVLHGGIGATSQFIFASQHDLIDAQLAGSEADLVVAGHCGLPFGHCAGNKLWFNAGVIGQPANDGTPDVWYAVLTRTETGITASLHRLAYAADAARDAVLAAGYADPYGTALGSGIWPNDDILPDAEKRVAGVRIPEMTFELPREDGVGRRGTSQEHAA